MKLLNTRLTFEALYVILSAKYPVGAGPIRIIFDFWSNLIDDTKLLFGPDNIVSFDYVNYKSRYRFNAKTQEFDDLYTKTYCFFITRFNLCPQGHVFGECRYHPHGDYYTYKCSVPECTPWIRSKRGNFHTKYKLEYNKLMRNNKKNCAKELLKIKKKVK